MKRGVTGIVIGLGVIVFVLLSGAMLLESSSGRSIPTSYWLWPGITAVDVPENADMYVFQGTFTTNGEKTRFARLGLFPHPLTCRRLTLVYRLDRGFPEIEEIVRVFEDHATRWKRHQVPVDAIQLDFDSPTSQLLEYSQFLCDVRRRLPEQYGLSITGLGDWAMSGDSAALRSISSSADEIVYQLYQGPLPLPDIDRYINRLRSCQLPFKIGLVTGSPEPATISRLTTNPYFRGIVYFVRRA